MTSVKWLAVLIAAVVLCSCTGDQVPAPPPPPTHEPDDTAESLKVVLDAFGPLIDALARQVDESTEAVAMNTKAVHYSPEPSTGDALRDVLLICSLPICFLLVTIIVFLYRDPQVARSIALFVGTWYHDKKARPVTAKPVTPVRNDDIDEIDEITIGS